MNRNVDKAKLLFSLGNLIKYNNNIMARVQDKNSILYICADEAMDIFQELSDQIQSGKFDMTEIGAKK